MTDRIDINRVLMDMRAIKAQVRPFVGSEGLAAKDIADPRALGPDRVNNTQQAKGPGFAELLENAISGVNDTQKASASLSNAYEQGQPGVDITDVMVASQKASVSFQAMLQVRNKLIDAYRDVMNMPI